MALIGDIPGVTPKEFFCSKVECVLDGSIVKAQLALNYNFCISLDVCSLECGTLIIRILPGYFPWHFGTGDFHAKLLLNNASVCPPLPI